MKEKEYCENNGGADRWEPVPGEPRLEACLIRREVRDARTKRLQGTGRSTKVTLSDGRQRSRLLLLYAVQQGIPVSRLADRKITVSEGRDGRLHAMLAIELMEDMRRKATRMRQKKTYGDTAARMRRLRETMEALEDYYTRGDGARLALLLNDDRRRLEARMRFHPFRLRNPESGRELAAEAMGLTLKAIQKGNPLFDTWNYMYRIAVSLITMARRRVRMMREYNDNVNPEEEQQ